LKLLDLAKILLEKIIFYPMTAAFKNKHFFVIRKQYSRKTQSGLTLVEVVVSMLVSSLFLGTALQAYVAATAMRTQGAGQKGAIAIAQNDMELIRDKAQNLDTSSPQVIYCASNGQGYGYRLMDAVKNQIAEDSELLRNAQVQSIPAASGQDAQEILIVEKPEANGDPAEYRLTRTISVPSNSQILSKDAVKIAYVIKDIRPKSNLNTGALGGGNPGNGQGNGNGAPNDVVVGEFDTAVIPAAAFSCP
jgi:Tfp pilus assembly protein PilV